MTTEYVNESRRKFLLASSSVLGGVGVVGAAIPFVASWKPSAKAKAAGAPVSVDISKLDYGAQIVVEWRGKPVYVIKRTTEAIADLDLYENGVLKDEMSELSTQPDYVGGSSRTLAGREEILVIVGLCTHLGCAPMYRPDVGAKDLGGESWLGGFFCPCHGSKFDLSGRVYAGVPAPSNLEVPPHKYESDNVIVIGVDTENV
ncbi:ubiquinol-cytochrome c reductase iron-sulfur subunit [Thalassolituus sp. UBA2590]|jgi:ubiquinol-cytochrome c reductase iron-sulfur subunit|uniref:ubiquinol-cytochrome c reductase iron-sulfur subunit n=1 Tax=Thalassolituus sp. UBA2590 TaxID=1947663 RepID=UPI0026490287|nr:ubiquinol-cytochrome c reductase iron-sulfur subunit [Thalassolituus sp. UBA2590]|tara:strand:- start:1543 stop:2148 length:606 start_codon:yes stop_codon:yes gene_type:complete